ncbi:MAG: helix-turn-helix domain-containing protein [Carboxylicivirga sp.]|jgi:hypothetical protein|nr:helix-turn-helix domain-containing protein [Carboxylicivirga sp.]
MFIDKEIFESWMKRLMERFDNQDKMLEALNKPQNTLDGERLFDNQDLCELLHVSKRTLQRYRSSGELPYHTIYHKTYYKESDIQAFIRTNFEKKQEKSMNTE